MFFFHLHSGLRYLYLLAAVATIGYAVYGLAARRPYDAVVRKLFVAMMLLLDATAFMGVATAFGRRYLSPGLGGHVASMIFAVVVVHVVSAVMRRRPPARRGYAPYLVAAVVALTLVWVGVASLGASLVG